MKNLKMSQKKSFRRLDSDTLSYGLWLIVWLASPSAKRIQTAEPQAAVGILSLLDFVISKPSLLAIVGSCGEAICVICVICGLIKIRVHSCSFVVYS